MTTQELLKEYNRLYDEDPAKAKCFVEANKDNQLFYNLVELMEAIVPALCAQKDFMINGITAAMAEDDSKIQRALMEHVNVEVTARVLDRLKESIFDDKK